MTVREAAGALLAVVLAAVVFGPIVDNYFYADDFLNLHTIANEPTLRWLLQPGGGHLLVLRNAVFAATYALFTTDPRPYFWTALATHLVNVGLVFAVVRRATGRSGLATLAASAFGTMPAAEGSLGWYAVYGHVLCGTFLLLALLRMLRATTAASVGANEAAVWAALLLAGALCFGVGVGVALALPAAALTLLGPTRLSGRARLLLLAFPISLIGLYVCIHVLTQRVYGGVSESQMLTLFGLVRFLGDAVSMLWVLIGAGTVALAGGLLCPLEQYPSMAGHALVAVALAIFAAGLVLSPSPGRRLLCALGLLLLGSYGVIAAGRGHLLANFRAYGAWVPRYHYVGPMVIAIALAVAINPLLERPSLRILPALLGGWGIALATAHLRSTWAINHFDADRDATRLVLRTIAATIDSTPADEPVFLLNSNFAPAVLGPPFFAGWASLWVIFGGPAHGRPVYFLDPTYRVWQAFDPTTPVARHLLPAPPQDTRAAVCWRHPRLVCSDTRDPPGDPGQTTNTTDRG